MCNEYICKVRGNLAAFGNLYEAHTLVCNMVNSGEVFYSSYLVYHSGCESKLVSNAILSWVVSLIRLIPILLLKYCWFRDRLTTKHR